MEILHRDIHPDVAVEIDHDGVDAADGVEDAAQVVVVADLRGPLLALQPEFLGDEAVGEGAPVILGVGDVVGVEIARGATKLCRELAGLESVELLAQAIDIDLDFLAQARRRGGLAMGLGEHRYVLPLLGISLELVDELLDLGIIDLQERLLDGQGARSCC